MSRGATEEGTKRYVEKFRGLAAEGHYREAQGLMLSSLGIGTYLGQPNERIDAGYAAALIAAVESGFNVIDTAINYRLQRSERSVGTALRVLAHKGFTREEIVVCTKAGYLTPDGAMPADPNRYFFEEYIQKGVFTAKDIAAGCHCMTPAYLENQLARSLKNLGVGSIDVYYLHNPETQLTEVSKQDFLMRFNLAMTEALTLGNQNLGGNEKTIMEGASELGITLVASASLLQGQVAQNLPAFVAEAFGLENDVERALQFARSAPGITTALVGMSRTAHVEANAKLVTVPPADLEQFSKLFSRDETA